MPLAEEAAVLAVAVREDSVRGGRAGRAVLVVRVVLAAKAARRRVVAGTRVDLAALRAIKGDPVARAARRKVLRASAGSAAGGRAGRTVSRARNWRP